MTNFDADILCELRDLQEVAIRTEKHPNTAVVIWVAVADEEVFVRSVRGTKGRWYRDLAAGGPATLEFVGRQLAVRHRPCRAADLDRGHRPLASGIGRLGTAWFARHWLSAGHLLRQPSECAGAGQDPAAGPRDNPRHRWRAHAASLSIAKLVFGAEKSSRDQAGRGPALAPSGSPETRR